MSENDKLTERELVIMNSAFMMGRVYSNTGEKEGPGEIDRKLVEHCLCCVRLCGKTEEPAAPLLVMHDPNYGGPKCSECDSDYPKRWMVYGKRYCINQECSKSLRKVPNIPDPPDLPREFDLEEKSEEDTCLDATGAGYKIDMDYHTKALEMFANQKDGKLRWEEFEKTDASGNKCRMAEFEKRMYGKITDRTIALLKVLVRYGGRSYEEVEASYRELGSIDEVVFCMDSASAGNRRMIDYAKEFARKKQVGGCTGQPDCKCRVCVYEAGKNIGRMEEEQRVRELKAKHRDAIADVTTRLIWERGENKILKVESDTLKLLAGKREDEIARLQEAQCLGTKGMEDMLTTTRIVLVRRDREIVLLNQLLDARNAVLDEIPECPKHGKQCMPHCKEWIKERRKA